MTTATHRPWHRLVGLCLGLLLSVVRANAETRKMSPQILHELMVPEGTVLFRGIHTNYSNSQIESLFTQLNPVLAAAAARSNPTSQVKTCAQQANDLLALGSPLEPLELQLRAHTAGGLYGGNDLWVSTTKSPDVAATFASGTPKERGFVIAFKAPAGALDVANFPNHLQVGVTYANEVEVMIPGGIPPQNILTIYEVNPQKNALEKATINREWYYDSSGKIALKNFPTPIPFDEELIKTDCEKICAKIVPK